jgi:hypothetical protein
MAKSITTLRQELSKALNTRRAKAENLPKHGRMTAMAIEAFRVAERQRVKALLADAELGHIVRSVPDGEMSVYMEATAAIQDAVADVEHEIEDLHSAGVIDAS